MTAREYVQSWADANGFWQWNQATDIIITRFTAQLRSYNKNTRVRLYCLKFGNDFAHITEKRIVIILPLYRKRTRQIVRYV